MTLKKDPDTSYPPIKDVAPSGTVSDAELREARLSGLEVHGCTPPPCARRFERAPARHDRSTLQPSQPAFRTGYPFCSARERNCLSANRRPRPAAGMRTPAHTPCAPGVSHASWAHCQRRGHARHSSLAPSSATVVHRSGSRAHKTS